MHNDDFLMHYGIKGMRWGVRRAIKSKNDKRIARQYAKAQKKLEKLSKRANVEEQRKIAEKYDKASKGARIAGRISLGIAAAGTGLTSGINHIYKPAALKKEKEIAKMKRLAEQHAKSLQDAKNIVKWTEITGIHNFEGNIKNHDIPYHTEMIKEYNNSAKDLANKLQSSNAAHNKIQKIGRTVQAIGAGGALGAYGYALGAKIKANKARKRMSGQAHRDAIEDRNTWQREMNRAFAGTKYANGRPASTSKKRRGSRRG